MTGTRAERVGCVELVHLVTDWMEGALDDGTEAAIGDHLAACPHCVEYLDQMQTTALLLAGIDLPPRTPPELLLVALRRRS